MLASVLGYFLKSRESLTGVSRLLAGQVYNIIHIPFLGGLFDPNAIGHIISGDAHGCLPMLYTQLIINPLSPNVCH